MLSGEMVPCSTAAVREGEMRSRLATRKRASSDGKMMRCERSAARRVAVRRNIRNRSGYDSGRLHARSSWIMRRRGTAPDHGPENAGEKITSAPRRFASRGSSRCCHRSEPGWFSGSAKTSTMRSVEKSLQAGSFASVARRSTVIRTRGSPLRRSESSPWRWRRIEVPTPVRCVRSHRASMRR